MKATKTKYTCDHCGAESEYENETPLGWFEVKNMTLGDEYHLCPKCVRLVLFEKGETEINLMAWPGETVATITAA